MEPFGNDRAPSSPNYRSIFHVKEVNTKNALKVKHTPVNKTKNHSGTWTRRGSLLGPTIDSWFVFHASEEIDINKVTCRFGSPVRWMLMEIKLGSDKWWIVEQVHGEVFLLHCLQLLTAALNWLANSLQVCHCLQSKFLASQVREFKPFFWPLKRLLTTQVNWCN